MKSIKKGVLILVIITAYNCTSENPTAFNIKSITINSLSFVSHSGRPWDNNNGPDVYLKISDHSGKLLYNNRDQKFSNILKSDFPLEIKLNNKMTIREFDKPMMVKIMEADETRDDLIISIKVSANTIISKSNFKFPDEYVIENNDGTNKITLALKWDFEKRIGK